MRFKTFTGAAMLISMIATPALATSASKLSLAPQVRAHAATKGGANHLSHGGTIVAIGALGIGAAALAAAIITSNNDNDDNSASN